MGFFGYLNVKICKLMKEKIKINPQNLSTITNYHKLMGVSIQTVYRWIKEGKVKKIEFLGREFIDRSTYKK